MKKKRPAFGLYLALIAIIVILGVIGYLIFKINDIEQRGIEQEEAAFSEQTELKKEKTDSNSQYLESLQSYKFKQGTLVSKEDAKTDDTASLVARGSEESNNSISVRIDNIVDSALSGAGH